MMIGFTEQLLYSTVRIETRTADGGRGSGTGFVYRANVARTPDGGHQAVIVTNRHVVEDAVATTYWLHVAGADERPDLGRHQRIELEGDKLWFFHPSLDLAFCGLYLPMEALKRRGFEPFYCGLDETVIPKGDEWDDIMAADDILMIGYPGGHWDEVHNLPFVRRGIIASIPSTEFQGRHEFPIDAACFAGSSGSPVFLAQLGRRLTREGVIVGGAHIKLIGVLWGGLMTTAEGEVVPVPVPVSTPHVAQVRIPMQVGLCLKADCLVDIDDMVAKLIDEEEQYGIPKAQRDWLDQAFPAEGGGGIGQ